MTPWTVAHQASLSTEFPGKDTGVGCHFLLQGIFPAQELNLSLLHWQVDSLLRSHQESPFIPSTLPFPCFSLNAGCIWSFATWVYYLWSNAHLHSLIQNPFAYWWKKSTGHLIPPPPLPKSLHQYKRRMGFLVVQQKDSPHPFSTTTKSLLEAKQNKTCLNFLL